MVLLPPWGSQGQDRTSRWESVGHSESRWDPQLPARVRGEQTRVQMGGIGRKGGVRDEDTGWNRGGGATGAEGPPRGFGRWGRADEGWGPGGEARWRDLFRAQPVPRSHRVTGETLRSRCPGPPTSTPEHPGPCLSLKCTRWSWFLPASRRPPGHSRNEFTEFTSRLCHLPVIPAHAARPQARAALPVASPCLPDLGCP